MNPSVEKCKTLYANATQDTVSTERVMRGTDALHTLLNLTDIRKGNGDDHTLDEMIEGGAMTRQIIHDLLQAGYELMRHETTYTPEQVETYQVFIRLTALNNNTDFKNTTEKELRATLTVLLATTDGDLTLNKIVDDLQSVGYTELYYADIINQLHYAVQKLVEILTVDENYGFGSTSSDMDEAIRKCNTIIERPTVFAYNLLQAFRKNVKMDYLSNLDQVSNTPGTRNMSAELFEQLRVVLTTGGTASVQHIMQLVAEHYVDLDMNPNTSATETETLDLKELHVSAMSWLKDTFLSQHGLMVYLAPAIAHIGVENVQHLDWHKINQAFYESLQFNEQRKDVELGTTNYVTQYNKNSAFAIVTSDDINEFKVAHENTLPQPFKTITSTHETRPDGSKVVSVLHLHNDVSDTYSEVYLYEEDVDGNRVEIGHDVSDTIDPYYVSDSCQHTLFVMPVPKYVHALFI